MEIADIADATIYGTGAGHGLGEAAYGAGDLSGDGLDDLVVHEPYGAGGSGALYVFAGSAVRMAGDYEVEFGAHAAVIGSAGSVVFDSEWVFADLDADGVSDAVVADDTTVLVLYGPIPGGTSYIEDLTVATLEGSAVGEVAVGRLDDDEYNDILIASPDDEELYVFVGKGI